MTDSTASITNQQLPQLSNAQSAAALAVQQAALHHPQHLQALLQSSKGKDIIQRFSGRSFIQRRQRRGLNDNTASTTPLVWLVVWSVACAGFLLGYTQGANVILAASFRDTFLPQLVSDGRLLVIHLTIIHIDVDDITLHSPISTHP